MHIVQYWHAADIPSDVLPLLASYRQLNPWAHHAVFDERAAEALISTHFTQREVKAFRACAVPAMQADYFRYCASLALGGVYADADSRCVGDIGPLVDRHHRSGAVFLRPNGNIMNGFFIFDPHTPLVRAALEVATANIESRIAEDVWLVTGPGIFSYMWALLEAGSFAATAARVANGTYEAIPRYIDLMCRTLGSFERLAALLRDVAVLPESALAPYVELCPLDLPYKQTELHWTHFSKSIFR